MTPTTDDPAVSAHAAPPLSHPRPPDNVEMTDVLDFRGDGSPLCGGVVRVPHPVALQHSSRSEAHCSTATGRRGGDTDAASSRSRARRSSRGTAMDDAEARERNTVLLAKAFGERQRNPETLLGEQKAGCTIFDVTAVSAMARSSDVAAQSQYTPAANPACKGDSVPMVSLPHLALDIDFKLPPILSPTSSYRPTPRGRPPAGVLSSSSTIHCLVSVSGDGDDPPSAAPAAAAPLPPSHDASKGDSSCGGGGGGGGGSVGGHASRRGASASEALSILTLLLPLLLLALCGAGLAFVAAAASSSSSSTTTASHEEWMFAAAGVAGAQAGVLAAMVAVAAWRARGAGGGVIGVGGRVFRAYRGLSYLAETGVDELRLDSALLHTMLPQDIILLIHQGSRCIATQHESLTFSFTDLVGFTKMTSGVGHRAFVVGLNTLFTVFDNLAAAHQVTKVKTIGDCYMAVTGYRQPEDVDHIKAMTDWAVAVMCAVAELRLPELKLDDVSVRVGVASGSAVSGVLGCTKPSFDFWGDVVNMAARMESLSQENRINCTEGVAQHLYHHWGAEFDVQPGQFVKGKGMMDTYLLLSEGLPSSAEGMVGLPGGMVFEDYKSEALLKLEKMQSKESFGDNMKELLSTMSELSQDMSMDDAAELVVSSVVRLLRCDRASLYMLDHANQQLCSFNSCSGAKIRMPLDRGVAGWVASHGKPLIIAEAYDDQRFNKEVDLRTGYRTRNILCCPVRRGDEGEVIAVLQGINKKVGSFDQHDAALLSLLGDQAGVRLMYGRMAEDISSAQQRWMLLNHTCAELRRCCSVDDVVRRVASACRGHLLLCESVRLSLRDPDGAGVLVFVGGGSEEEDVSGVHGGGGGVGGGSGLRRPTPFACLAAARGSVVSLRAAAAEEGSNVNVAEEDDDTVGVTENGLACPIVGRGGVVGVLEVCARVFVCAVALLSTTCKTPCSCSTTVPHNTPSAAPFFASSLRRTNPLRASSVPSSPLCSTTWRWRATPLQRPRRPPSRQPRCGPRRTPTCGLLWRPRCRESPRAATPRCTCGTGWQGRGA